jgi:hypothetical protein
MALTRPRASQIYNLDYKQAVRAVATSNITLSGGAPAVVDGVSLNVNDRVLCTAQSTASQNLIYVVTTVGTGVTGTWTTAYDDTTGEGTLDAGTIVMVTEGQTYADTQWKLITDNPITIGTTNLTWTQNYSANSISSGSSNVVVTSNANVTISSAGTANVLTVSNTGAYVTGIVSATGNITGNYFVGNGSQLTGVSSPLSGNLAGNLLANGYYINNLTQLSVSGNITAGNILNSGANGVGNIGSSTTYFNTVFAKATSAQYADLAEMYVADQSYPAGTVVEFGGVYEITQTRSSHSTQVAGVISTNPSYLMNSTQDGEYVLPVALTGRVPCRVVGLIAKGDRLVASNIPGVACVLNMNNYEPGCIIGKALESYDSEVEGVIEIAVGRY